MKQDAIFRCIAAGLLNSDLSHKELLDFADRLCFDRRFQEELSFFVRELAQITSQRGRKPVSSDDRDAYRGNERFVQTIMNALNRKRMRKLDALNLLENISSEHTLGWLPNSDRTLRANVESLILSTSPHESRTLVERVSKVLETQNDPYLSKML